jgi:3-hydroxyisobutyrate dehydrogenase-like beta-hydroxyacid dehydrogenase
VTSAASPKVALCGLGPMGAPIAARILASGRRLTVWNRTAARAEPFAELGAVVAASPSAAAAPVVLTVLPDLAQVEEVLHGERGLAHGWRERGIDDPVLVIHGTTSPSATAAFAVRSAEQGITVVDAPVSGGTVGARDGTLSIMLGGVEERARALLPLLRSYGRVITYFGPPGSGALAKACNQVIVAATVASVSEAVALARSGGIDAADLFPVLEGGLAGSEVIRQKKDNWIEERYADGGSGRNQLKDLGFVRDAADGAGLDLPVADAVRRLFERMVARGDGDLDHTGVIRAVRAGRGGER